MRSLVKKGGLRPQRAKGCERREWDKASFSHALHPPLPATSSNSTAALRPVAEQVVGQDQGDHGFGDRHGADGDAGIVPAFGGDFGVRSLRGDGRLWG